MDFSQSQMLRYARQIIMPEIGGRGQAAMLGARVLLIGAGGLGSPLLLYLAAAGIGTIGIVDHDVVDLSNLHRQIAHATARIGDAKIASALASARALNPDIELVGHEMRLDADNAGALVEAYDIVADGSDNFATRDAVHAACHQAGRTLVSGSIQGFDGQLSTYKAHLGPPHPCFRCLFSTPPAPGAVPSCAQGGVLGPAAGVIGAMQAVEVVKELLSLGDSLSGTLVMYDALATRLHRISLPRDPSCVRCGTG